MCSSTRSAACQSASTSTPRRARALRASASSSAGARCSVSATRVDAAGDEVGARRARPRCSPRARCRRRPGSRCRPGARSPRRARHEVARAVRLQRARRVVEEDARRRRAPAAAAPARAASPPRRCGRRCRRGRRRTRGPPRGSPRPPRAGPSTSFSGSWMRKTSMPFSAAVATKRRIVSPSKGREPTRKRPRSAIASGVSTRALSARIRSHGLSMPRLTAVSKQPPPETSRTAKPAPSRISARRDVRGRIRPASGSWPSRRIVVSTSPGTAGSLDAQTLRFPPDPNEPMSRLEHSGARYACTFPSNEPRAEALRPAGRAPI